MGNSFAIVGDEFQLDGKPFRVLSGALHYFRVPREYWADRIRKAHQMGLNTIETYVPWNLHQPQPGTWVTEGNLDLAAFIDAVHAEGMKAIVRPGPFICAEFSGGGLPGWLLDSGRTPVRTSDPRYLEPTLDYLDRVNRIIEPRQITHGGPVILVQIENEYGAYGDDKSYLRSLTEATREAGITVPLTTVDQPRPDMLPQGTLPELLTTASFGSRSAQRLRYLREVQPTGPLMCSEFWDGWFDQWGEYHHVTSAAEAAMELRTLLELGASVNIYMVHGGTNFGFTNGANNKGLYRQIVTSYDYDAPIDEAGNPTDKYWAFQEVLKDFTDVAIEKPAEATPAPCPEVTLKDRAAIASGLRRAQWQEHNGLPTMDELGLYEGFIAYRTHIPSSADGSRLLRFEDVRDRAVVFLDGVVQGVIERTDNERSLVLPADGGELMLLVEDQGRVNYGPTIGEPKGLIGPAYLDDAPLSDWSFLPLHWNSGKDAEAIVTSWDQADSQGVREPTMLRMSFSIDEPTDLFLDTKGWGHGLVWVNGTLLGRYWRRGPQRTLYVPAPFLVSGVNELTILELDRTEGVEISFLPHADLGPIDW